MDGNPIDDILLCVPILENVNDEVFRAKLENLGFVNARDDIEHVLVLAHSLIFILYLTYIQCFIMCIFDSGITLLQCLNLSDLGYSTLPQSVTSNVL